ncbi:uncharacterized protein THITE_2089064 [Thermothielavioides terrestris NRRL 8126]|uniref:Uncharacterized protein n=1 Tax=Thermothielavioides terrestris (strain ATCC 38088 / NRRL 8126) TaxID=578455 RepID=G2R636_THETT|nr:uncharacterized protein THITE_2089064 [Thermothielavioides terrestris NRRL 8126]AEO67573.1 hypothetical protein THITE_2089064 [Thermothielavioides terrestris NRRL 8126]
MTTPGMRTNETVGVPHHVLLKHSENLTLFTSYHALSECLFDMVKGSDTSFEVDRYCCSP